jgi:hypothetical protein
MKTIQKFLVLIALITLFAACQSAADPNQVLSKKETRDQVMNTIANDSVMSKEMMGALMNSKIGMMVMQQHAMMMMESHSSMMDMAKNNPGMMNNMMSAMIETAKGDTSMMSGMIKTMMGNPQMMEMMQKMTGSKGKMSMHHMGGMGK